MHQYKKTEWNCQIYFTRTIGRIYQGKEPELKLLKFFKMLTLKKYSPE